VTKCGRLDEDDSAGADKEGGRGSKWAQVLGGMARWEHSSDEGVGGRGPDTVFEGAVTASER